MKLNIFHNESKSISDNKPNYILKTDSKKEYQNKNEFKNFTPKKKLYNNNLILANISNIINKEKKSAKKNQTQKILNKNSNSKKDKNIINSMKRNKRKISSISIKKGISLQELNTNMNNNINNNKEKTTKLISKKYSYNNHNNYTNDLTKENKSSKNNKILNTSIPIAHNKNFFRTKSKEKTKKINNKINNISIIKNKYSKSMVQNNSISSLNIIYSNNNNNITDKINHNEKILVIDLDETLIHTSFKKLTNYDFKIQFDSTVYTQKNIEDKNIQELTVQKIREAYICIRPGVNEFLSQLSKYYDLYVYSASSKQYLNNVIKNIDKKNIIKKCYCRDDCIIYVENTEENLDFNKQNNKYNYVKDLKKINKDLRNIVFIDNNIMSFKLQEKNGIPIKSWYDDNDDIELYKLIPILKNLSGFYDVRIEIEKFVQNKTFIWSKSINWLKENCLNSAYLNEVNLVLKKEQQKCEFKMDNFKNSNNFMKTGKNKIINHINNILINLNEINANTLNKSMKHMVNKPNKFYEKLKTDFKKQNQRIKNKTLNTNEITLFNTDKKTHLIRNKKTKTLTNKIMNKTKFSDYSQKTKINSSQKKEVKDNIIIKTILPHQRSIYIPKLNLFNKLELISSKKKEILSSDNNSKNVNNNINNKKVIIKRNIFKK